MSAAGAKSPALFCDRDGTLIREMNFIADPGDVELIPGTSAAIKRAREAEYLIIVVTNQSGVARNLFSTKQVESVNNRLLELLAIDGATIDAIYYCPHHPAFTGECGCRKPATGMVETACNELAIDLPASYVIGDSICDIALAENAGARGIMVRTGFGEEESLRVPASLAKTPIVADFPEAVNLILKGK